MDPPKKTKGCTSKNYGGKCLTPLMSEVYQSIQNNEPSKANQVLSVLQNHSRNVSIRPTHQCERRTLVARVGNTPRQTLYLCERNSHCRSLLAINEGVRLVINIRLFSANEHAMSSYSLAFDSWIAFRWLADILQHLLRCLLIDSVCVTEHKITSMLFHIDIAVNIPPMLVPSKKKAYNASSPDFTPLLHIWARRVFNGFSSEGLNNYSHINQRRGSEVFFAELRKVNTESDLLVSLIIDTPFVLSDESVIRAQNEIFVVTFASTPKTTFLTKMTHQSKQLAITSSSYQKQKCGQIDTQQIQSFTSPHCTTCSDANTEQSISKVIASAGSTPIQYSKVTSHISSCKEAGGSATYEPLSFDSMLGDFVKEEDNYLSQHKFPTTSIVSLMRQDRYEEVSGMKMVFSLNPLKDKLIAAREKPQQIVIPQVPDNIISYSMKEGPPESRLPGPAQQQKSSTTNNKPSLVSGSFSGLQSSVPIVSGGQLGETGCALSDGQSSLVDPGSHSLQKTPQTRLGNAKALVLSSGPRTTVPTKMPNKSQLRKSNNAKELSQWRNDSIDPEAFLPATQASVTVIILQEISPVQQKSSQSSSPLLTKAKSHPCKSSCQASEPLGGSKEIEVTQTLITPLGQSSPVRMKATPCDHLPQANRSSSDNTASKANEVLKLASTDGTMLPPNKQHSDVALPDENTSKQVFALSRPCLPAQASPPHTHSRDDQDAHSQQDGGSCPSSPASMVMVGMQRQTAQDDTEALQVSSLSVSVSESAFWNPTKLLARQQSYTEELQREAAQQVPPPPDDVGDPLQVELEVPVQVSTLYPVESFCLLINGTETVCSRRIVTPTDQDTFPIEDGSEDGPPTEAQLLQFPPTPTPALPPQASVEPHPLSAMHIDGNDYQSFNTLAEFIDPALPGTLSNQYPSNVFYEGAPYAVMFPAPVRYCRGYRDRAV